MSSHFKGDRSWAAVAGQCRPQSLVKNVEMVH